MLPMVRHPSCILCCASAHAASPENCYEIHTHAPAQDDSHLLPARSCLAWHGTPCIIAFSAATSSAATFRRMHRAMQPSLSTLRGVRSIILLWLPTQRRSIARPRRPSTQRCSLNCPDQSYNLRPRYPDIWIWTYKVLQVCLFRDMNFWVSRNQARIVCIIRESSNAVNEQRKLYMICGEQLLDHELRMCCWYCRCGYTGSTSSKMSLTEEWAEIPRLPARCFSIGCNVPPTAAG